MASAAGIKTEENEFSLESLEEIEVKVCNAVNSAGKFSLLASIFLLFFFAIPLD